MPLAWNSGMTDQEEDSTDPFPHFRHKPGKMRSSSFLPSMDFQPGHPAAIAPLPRPSTPPRHPDKYFRNNL